MSFINDREAFILANTCGFNPPKACGPAKSRSANTGKYETGTCAESDKHWMLLASYLDKTNILIKYNPAELILP